MAAAKAHNVAGALPARPYIYGEIPVGIQAGWRMQLAFARRRRAFLRNNAGGALFY